jgi:outer membrane immunogenic protein
MKKLALAVTALAALSGQALAADMPMKAARPAPQPVAVANWTGCYISGGIGYGLWDQENTGYDYTGGTRIRATDSWDTGGRGWLGRAQGGCDYQFSGIGSWNMVIGVFGDYDWANLHGRATEPVFGSVANEKLSSQWAIGGRIGLLVTPALLTYFSGGYTEANFDQLNPVNNVQGGFCGTGALGSPCGVHLPARTYKGWFLGSGLEYSLGWAPGLTLKTEYRFSEFDLATNTIYDNFTNLPFGGGLGAQIDSRKYVQTVTTSLVYKFNWGKSPVGKSPVVAKY